MSANGSENQNAPASEQETLVYEHLSNTEFHLALLNEGPTDISKAVKLSIEALSELGLVLSSLPKPALEVIAVKGKGARAI